MEYISKYNSPLGEILLACNQDGLSGVWINNQKYYALNLNEEYEEYEAPILIKTKEWLDIYFQGKEPGLLPKLNIRGTDFQNKIWSILLNIPYGKLMTYGEIASKVAKINGISRMSAQAVGGAVGHNNISIIIPCHRVIGSDGSLTGYAGGLSNKKRLLELEGIKVNESNKCIDFKKFLVNN